jgi:hypothetical protein
LRGSENWKRAQMKKDRWTNYWRKTVEVQINCQQLEEAHVDWNGK